MFNYELIVKDDKGNKVTEYQLDKGESRKGTFATLSGKPANKAIPFGKLYVNEEEIAKTHKALSKTNGK